MKGKPSSSTLSPSGIFINPSPAAALGSGLEVTGVSNGKMAEGGVRKGFIILKVNNVPMKTVEDLEKVMKEAAKTQEQVLFITGMFPSGKRGSYAVSVAQD